MTVFNILLLLCSTNGFVTSHIWNYKNKNSYTKINSEEIPSCSNIDTIETIKNNIKNTELPIEYRRNHLLDLEDELNIETVSNISKYFGHWSVAYLPIKKKSKTNYYSKLLTKILMPFKYKTINFDSLESEFNLMEIFKRNKHFSDLDIYINYPKLKITFSTQILSKKINVKINKNLNKINDNLFEVSLISLYFNDKKLPITSLYNVKMTYLDQDSMILRDSKNFPIFLYRS